MPVFLNDVKVAGNLTRDPEMRDVGNDNVVTKFGLAINRKYKASNGEVKENTTFVDIELWNRQAELAYQYLQKGSNVLVEGELKLDTWKDKEGNNRSRMMINGRRVHFINTGDKKERKAPTESESRKPEVYDDMEPPF